MTKRAYEVRSMDPASHVAVVFPGQGSQRTGMARDFHERFAAAREVFAEASDALDVDLRRICFEEDPRLDLTEWTQPAILTAEIAMFRVLVEELGLRATRFGGHSLGEYTALCAAGVIPLATAVRLVRTRGALMQSAVPVGEGAMIAVIAEGIAAREGLVREDDVDVANYNSPDQVVLSGGAAAIESASRRLHAEGCEIVPLQVSAPFHSRRMRAIEPDFRAALEAVASHFEPTLAATVTSNLRGGFHVPYTAPLIDALVGQISGSVDWVANMKALGAAAGRVFEVGPHRPLRGFFRSLGRDVTSILSVKTAEAGLAS